MIAPYCPSTRILQPTTDTPPARDNNRKIKIAIRSIKNNRSFSSVRINQFRAIPFKRVITSHIYSLIPPRAIATLFFRRLRLAERLKRLLAVLRLILLLLLPYAMSHLLIIIISALFKRLFRNIPSLVKVSGIVFR